MKKYIKLDEAPEILRNRVTKYLEENGDSEIINVCASTQNFYRDKSIVSTFYTVSVMRDTLCITFDYKVCSKNEWTDKKVNKNFMTVRGIMEFARNSLWFNGIRKEDKKRDPKMGD